MLLALLLIAVAQRSDAQSERQASSDVGRETILVTHRILLLQPPAAALVDELFDFYLIVSERAATGEISAAWAAYLYVNYWRDAERDGGGAAARARLSQSAQRAWLAEQVEFFYVRKRPESVPSPFGAWVWQAAPRQ
jgi:hypothetical protein